MKLGVKAHYRDVNFLRTLRPAMVEIHTTAKDIKNPGMLIEGFREWRELSIIHVPIYLDRPEGESQLVDLASPDVDIRKESIEMVVNTCQAAARLGSSFVVVHPGGVTQEDLRSTTGGGKLGGFEREMLLNDLSLNLQFSLVEVAAENGDAFPASKLLLENMPYHFWKDDGKKWYSQLLVEAREAEDYMSLVGGLCLDICHAFLARTAGGYEVMDEFLTLFGRRIRHVHISDARAPDGEGLQIGEGQIGFTRVARALKSRTRYDELTGIPEIKDGHLNRGAGFRKALDILRTIF